MSNKQTHYHVVVFFYEKRDEQGNFQGSTKFDFRSDKSNPTEAVKECIDKAKELAEAGVLDHAESRRMFFHVKDVIEHDHALGENEKQ